MNLKPDYNQISLFQIDNSLKFHRKDERNQLGGQSVENFTT